MYLSITVHFHTFDIITGDYRRGSPRYVYDFCKDFIAYFVVVQVAIRDTTMNPTSTSRHVGTTQKTWNLSCSLLLASVCLAPFR